MAAYTLLVIDSNENAAAGGVLAQRAVLDVHVKEVCLSTAFRMTAATADGRYSNKAQLFAPSRLATDQFVFDCPRA